MLRTALILSASLLMLSACGGDPEPTPVATESLDPLTGQPMDPMTGAPLASPSGSMSPGGMASPNGSPSPTSTPTAGAR